MSFLHYLQTRSPQAKSRIIALGGAVAFLALGSVWLNSVKSQLSGIGEDDILPGQVAGTAVSAEDRITLESFENRDGKTRLHFKITNGSPDVLNFSPIEQIELNVDGLKMKPDDLLDRQAGPFPKKILSNHTAYGTLTFPQLDGTQGTLTFDEMFFERNSGALFKEMETLDLEKLKKVDELRS